MRYASVDANATEINAKEIGKSRAVSNRVHRSEILRACICGEEDLGMRNSGLKVQRRATGQPFRPCIPSYADSDGGGVSVVSSKPGTSE